MALQPRNLRLRGLFGTEPMHENGWLGAVEDKVKEAAVELSGSRKLSELRSMQGGNN